MVEVVRVFAAATDFTWADAVIAKGALRTRAAKTRLLIVVLTLFNDFSRQFSWGIQLPRRLSRMLSFSKWLNDANFLEELYFVGDGARTLGSGGRSIPGFARKVPAVASVARLHIKSELGAIATSRTLNFSEVGAPLGCIFMS